VQLLADLLQILQVQDRTAEPPNLVKDKTSVPAHIAVIKPGKIADVAPSHLVTTLPGWEAKPGAELQLSTEVRIATVPHLPTGGYRSLFLETRASWFGRYVIGWV